VSDSPADPRVRLARLPQARRRIIMPPLLVLATLALGFTFKLSSVSASAEFRLDQLLSKNYNLLGDATALTIKTVLSPPGIILILLVMFALLLFVRRSPVNAFAVCSVIAGLAFTVLVGRSPLYSGVHYPSDIAGSFLVATAAITFYVGPSNRYGMPVLRRVSLLNRLGPVPTPDQPGRHRSIGNSAPGAL
jgi:hypothetical protein